MFRRISVLVALHPAGHGFEFQLPGTQDFLVGTIIYAYTRYPFVVVSTVTNKYMLFELSRRAKGSADPTARE